MSALNTILAQLRKDQQQFRSHSGHIQPDTEPRGAGILSETSDT